MTRQRHIRRSVLAAAARYKPRGYLEACEAAGRVEGEFIVIPEAAWKELGKQFAGWGDKLHEALKPIVKGTRFEACGGCQRRQRKLNGLAAAFYGAVNRFRA